MSKNQSSVKGLQNLTPAQVKKSSYLARRIQRDMRCSNEEATRTAIAYVKEFGSI